jgi:N-acetyl-anhydromuramoyl-L-alanine amidase
MRAAASTSDALMIEGEGGVGVEVVGTGGPAAARSDWAAGWLCRARRCESPNFGLRPPGMEVDLVLIHSISLPPGEFGGAAIERLFTNQLDWDAHPSYEQLRGLEVSAHFVVLRDGELRQFVSCDRRAWHAGASRWRDRSDCNDFSIGVELEGLEGMSFEPAQYLALARLMRDIAAQYGVTSVAGHEHVAPGRKQDPGCGFDWSLMIALLGWPLGCFPSEVKHASGLIRYL